MGQARFSRARDLIRASPADRSKRRRRCGSSGSALGFASFQAVQVFKVDGREPMPRRLLDGVVGVVVAGDTIPLLAEQICSSPSSLPSRKRGRGESPSMTTTLVELAIR